MALRHECFHIRISADQCLFAAPHSFSQLITSFIGSWCQGIRLMLLFAWTFLSVILSNYLVLFVLLELLEFHKTFFRLFPLCSLKTFFPFVHWFHFFHLSVKLYFFTLLFNRKTYTNLLIFVLFVCSFFLLFNLFLLFGFQWSCLLTNSLLVWLAQVDSNHRPRAYQARALTTWAMRHYGYSRGSPHVPLVEMMGIEPMTPCLQGRCSPSWATPPYGVSFFEFP